MRTNWRRRIWRRYSALAAAEYRAAQRRAVQPVARLRGCRRFAAGDVRDQPVHRAQPAPSRFRPGRCVRHPQRRAISSGRLGNAYLARIERPHEFSVAFRDTNWIPGAENRIPVAPGGQPGVDGGSRLCGLSAGVVVSRCRRGRANRLWCVRREGHEPPGLLSRAISSARCGESGHTDLARLLRNSIRWVAGANPPSHHRRQTA